MKDSEILKQARKLIKQGNEKYICSAIGSVGSSAVQEASLITWVGSMLGNNLTLGGWLKHNQRIPCFYGDYEKHHRELRLRWLDWMIKECEKAEAKA